MAKITHPPNKSHTLPNGEKKIHPSCIFAECPNGYFLVPACMRLSSFATQVRCAYQPNKSRVAPLTDELVTDY